MSNRKVLIALIILMIALSTNWFLDRPVESDDPYKPASDEPEFYMRNASIKQLDTGGKLQHIVTANEFVHFSLSQITSMLKPEIQLFSEKENDPWNIISEKGEILPQKSDVPETLKLWGNVVASISYADGEFVNIKSDRLRVIPETEFVEALADVSVKNSMGSTTAAGMSALLGKKQYNFFSKGKTRVNSVFIPETPLDTDISSEEFSEDSSEGKSE